MFLCKVIICIIFIILSMLKRLVILLLFVQVSYGQTKDGIELCLEYQKIVSGFTSEKEANEALDKILNVIGASKNFTLIPCDNINNALAITFKGDRYILFDSEFMNQITQLTNNWSSIFILAHEVGHHINGHTREALLVSVLDDVTLEKKREEELEADEFASFILAKLGASLDDINAGIELITTNDDDTYSTHPSQDKRLLAIRTGYARAQSTRTSNQGNKQYDYVEPEIVVESNWEYVTKTKQQYMQELNKEFPNLDPFEIKEYIDGFPNRWKVVKVDAISLDGTSTFTLVFEIRDFGFPFGIPPVVFNSLDSDMEEFVKNNNFNGGSFEIYIDNFEDSKLIQRDTEDEYFKNELEQLKDNYDLDELKNQFKFITNVSPGRFELEYIVDNDSGKLGLSFPHYKNNNGKIEPARLTILHDWPTKTVNSNPLKNEYIFINSLKKGKKLYLKLGNLIDYRREKLNLSPEINKKIQRKTYVIDLTGSSKALSF